MFFASGHYYGRELTSSEIPRVQGLFEANPEYFLAVHGRPPEQHEAQAEFDDDPPPHIPFSRRWFTGLFDREHELIGVAGIVSDLGAAHVWHIALYLIATPLHGQGAAGEIYAALEAWMQQSGARWLRLGVVQGHTRAERFWARRGFREVRLRPGAEVKGCATQIRVLVKPLTDDPLAEYLTLMPRDHPDSTLP